MEAWFACILKANACLAGFYAFYWLFLRRSTFLTVNRVYLLAGLAASFVIPLLKIPMPAAAPLPVWDFEPAFLFATEDVLPDGAAPAETIRAPFPVWSVAAGVYFAGVFVLLLRLIVSLVWIFRLKRRAGMACVEGRIVRTTDGTSAFSFFRAIFLPRSGNLRLVLEHEKVHVRQGHTCDLLFMEAAALLLWFNPAVWLYRRALKLLHEYLADEGVVRRQGGPRAYLECVLDYVRSGIPGLPVHAFGNNDHSLKKRIAMMTKNKTPRRFAWIYLLALPLVGALTFGFSAQAEMPLAQQTVPVQQAPTDDAPSIYPLDQSKVEEMHVNRNPLLMGFRTSPGHVYATAAGTVVEIGKDAQWLDNIIIRHGDTYTTRYGMHGQFSVKVGDRVEKGQIIGELTREKALLMYQINKNGTPIDPGVFLSEQALNSDEAFRMRDRLAGNMRAKADELRQQVVSGKLRPEDAGKQLAELEKSLRELEERLMALQNDLIE